VFAELVERSTALIKEVSMAKRTITDEQMSWLHYVLGYTAPEIKDMLESQRPMLVAAALGLLDLAEISAAELLAGITEAPGVL
jgi:hypothetical protein